MPPKRKRAEEEQDAVEGHSTDSTSGDIFSTSCHTLSTPHEDVPTPHEDDPTPHEDVPAPHEDVPTPHSILSAGHTNSVADILSTDGALSTPLNTTFSLRKLPIELRFLVYHHTWEPREVTIRKPGFKNNLPATLFVDKESRHETLRHYHLYITKYISQVGRMYGYINPNLDTLHVRMPRTFPPMRHPLEICIPTLLEIGKPVLSVCLNPGTMDELPAKKWLFERSGLRGIIVEVDIAATRPPRGPRYATI